MSDETVVTTPVETEPQITEQQAAQMPMHELRRVAIEGAAPQSTEPPQSEPQQDQPYTLSQDDGSFCLKYRTGEVFKGASELEVYRKAAENAVRNVEYAKTIKRQYEQFMQDHKPVSMADAPGEPEMAAEAQRIQQEELRRYFAENILTPEMKREIAAEAFGVPVEALPQAYAQINEAWRQNHVNTAVTGFQVSCPDYGPSPENDRAIMQQLEHLPNDYVPTAADLQTAWARALYSGAARPYVPHKEQPRIPPPPPMPGAGASGTQAPNPWTMDIKQLRKEALG